MGPSEEKLRGRQASCVIVDELAEPSKLPKNPKNRERNLLCPCGSGRKYKKCHWYSGYTK